MASNRGLRKKASISDVRSANRTASSSDEGGCRGSGCGFVEDIVRTAWRKLESLTLGRMESMAENDKLHAPMPRLAYNLKKSAVGLSLKIWRTLMAPAGSSQLADLQSNTFRLMWL